MQSSGTAALTMSLQSWKNPFWEWRQSQKYQIFQGSSDSKGEFSGEMEMLVFGPQFTNTS